jgi:putative endonuclease
MNSAHTGKDAEQRACDYLVARGLSLRVRNFQSRHGEIDLIMNDGNSLVFVEVRYRRTGDFGAGAESVDRRKQARITACAQRYLQEHPAAAQRPCRFDVVALTGVAGQPQIEWIRDAFPALG